MRRRALVALVGAGAAPGLVLGQAAPGGVRRIGFLSPQSAQSGAGVLAALRDGLLRLGWAEGRDYGIEARFAGGRENLLLGLARELIELRVELIVAGSNPGAIAAKHAAGNLPVVMVTTGDPVAAGLVETLARPGTNVTGLTTQAQDLGSKQLELLRELLPGLQRVAVLAKRDGAYTPAFSSDLADAAQAISIDLHVREVGEAGDLTAAFAALAGWNPQGLLVVPDILFITQRARIVQLAADHRLPGVYWERTFVDAGGLMFYGASLIETYRYASRYVDRILKGARPSELPVEQPTSYELVINLSTALALGLLISPALLARANEVVE